MVNAAVSQVSIDLGVKGPAYTIASACSSGTHAIGQAFLMVQAGQVPVAIAGGTEACLTVGTIKCWEALRVLSSDTCRPFSKTRSGLVLGEGAAMLVLETRERAPGARRADLCRDLGLWHERRCRRYHGDRSRGRRPRHARGAAECQDQSGGFDYVNAHGTGTDLNDRVETSALRKAFGASADRLAISSSKAVLGHSLGRRARWNWRQQRSHCTSRPYRRPRIRRIQSRVRSRLRSQCRP